MTNKGSYGAVDFERVSKEESAMLHMASILIPKPPAHRE